jgi:hypothetical protein
MSLPYWQLSMLANASRSRRGSSAWKIILLLIAALFTAHYIAVAGAHLGFWADGRLVGHR